MSDSGKPKHIESFLNNLEPVLSTVDQILNEWTGEGCLQLPELLSRTNLKLNWDERQARAYDPIIREFIRNHPEWHVTRGARGGIMRASDKQKKLDAEVAKKKAKDEIKAILDAKTSITDKVAVSTTDNDSE